MTPYFSIIVPTFNSENTLRECLQSIESFKFPRDQWELILVDCHSEDRTRLIAADFNLKLITIQNRSRSVARNTGAEAAKGEVLVFVDSNSIVSSDFLLRIKENIELADSFQSSIDKVYQGNDHDSLSRFLWRVAGKNQTLSFKNHDQSYPLLNTAAFAIKRNSFVQTGGFDPSFIRWEDRAFGIRLIQQGFSILFLENSVSFKIHRSESFSKNFERFCFESKYFSYYGKKYISKNLDLARRISNSWFRIHRRKNWPPDQKRPEIFWELLWFLSNIINFFKDEISIEEKILPRVSSSIMRGFTYQGKSYEISLNCGHFYNEDHVTFHTENGLITLNSYCIKIIHSLINGREVASKEFLILKILESKKIVLLKEGQVC